ncbi:MAG: hypothetical protein GY841_18020 [FCB group bacterium]|nr:hypothetical protein [FCB group bacterium]
MTKRAKKSPQGTVDLEKLREMLQAGIKQTEIAQHMGVTPAAITRAKKRIGFETQTVVLSKMSTQYVDSGFNVFEQLSELNGYAKSILQTLVAAQDGDKAAQAKLALMADSKSPREMVALYMREIRAQMQLQKDIFSQLYDIKVSREFRRAVLEVIEDVDPRLRDEIEHKLRRRASIFNALAGDKSQLEG